MKQLRRPGLSVGFLLVPRFTMLAFVGFVDALRLAADEADRSRPIHCSWAVMTADRQPAVSSAGVAVCPTEPLGDPTRFDYIVVVGGTLHDSAPEDPRLVDYLALAARGNVPLIGVCTGSFVLARAGLMRARTSCVSWFHYDDFTTEFPGHAVVGDRLFLIDRDRITCAGGTSVIHLASHLIERHCGPGAAAKGLRIMLEDGQRVAGAPQPQDGVAHSTHNRRARRAMLLMERSISQPIAIDDVAREVNTSRRNLERIFRNELGMSPDQYRARIRLDRAQWLVKESDLSMIQIAQECGFADASHFSRRFRSAFGTTPREARLRRADTAAA